MEEKKCDNIYKKSNWLPFEQERKHANEIINNLTVSTRSGPNSNGNNIIESIHISPPPDNLECKFLGEKAKKLWLDSLAKHGSQKVSLSLVFFQCMVWDYLWSLLLGMFTHWITVLVVVQCLSRFLAAIEQMGHLKYDLSLNVVVSGANQSMAVNNKSEPSNDVARASGEIYEEIVLLISLLWLATSAFYIASSYCKLAYLKCGLKARIIMTQLIRNKSLRVHLSLSIKDSSSRALSLLSNEVAFIEEAHKMLCYVIIGPGSLILASVWLALTQVGWLPVIMTLPFIVIFIILQTYLATSYKKISKKRKLDTNARLDTIQTALCSMKVVKLYAWERQFREKVDRIRENELKQVKLLDKFQIFDLIAIGISNRLLPAIVFLGNILLYGNLDKKILFTTSASYTFWRTDGILRFPKGMRALSDILTACKNIKQYLLLEEFQDQRVCLAGSSRVRIISEGLSVSLSEKELFKSSEIQEPTTRVINGLDMDLESGDLVFVVGPVGSGKSSLLLTLLGETRITAGQLKFTNSASFSYASQEACLFPETFRNNIINGRVFESERYNRVLDICSLWPDLNQLPNSDQTLVGSKGVALSGGQKARLSLARAIYSKADVYLLDDPLSALDTKVARDIFTNCICKFLAEKLVILVTHQLQFLESADKIVFLNNRETKPIYGRRSELLQKENFRSMLNDYKRLASSMGTESSADNQSGPDKMNTVGGNKQPPANEKGLTYLRSGAGNFNTVQESPSYLHYLRLSFSNRELLIFLPALIAFLAISCYNDYYFRIWSRNLEAHEHDLDEDGHLQYMFQQWLLFMAVLFSYLKIMWFYFRQLTVGFRRASKRLHQQMIGSLFNAKMSFFDFCNTGELSSRYAGDFGIIDHPLVQIATFFAFILGTIVSMFVPMILINPVQLASLIVLLLILLPTGAGGLRRLRILLQYNNALRSPVYTSLTSTINELSTIRSESDHLMSSNGKFNRSQNRLTSMSLLSFTYECRFSIIVKTIASLLNGMTLYIVVVVFYDDLDVSSTGTYLTLALAAFNLIPYLIEFGGILERSMMSVNRVKMLTELEPEEGSESKAKTITEVPAVSPVSLVRQWTVGQVSFREVSMKYFDDEEPAIKNLTFTIQGGERVGIVGRTGAGKSSIVSILFRLYPFNGDIQIDGIDIKSLELHELRASLGVIPQDPVLFSDSLRKNLDPSEQFSDEEIWRALEVVNLKHIVLHDLVGRLEELISEGGRNFSVGQRQLICLARAVLRSPKILLIDEATANVDNETDAFIQQTVRAHFSTSTIITVAHRLNTVLDYDRIMVLDAGRIVEFDSVQNLLELEGGVFKSMLQSTSSSIDDNSARVVAYQEKTHTIENNGLN